MTRLTPQERTYRPAPEDIAVQSPLLFDLTRIARPSPPPQVYYLVPDPVPSPSSPWRAVVGFGAVVGAGLGIGLLLAFWLV